MSEPINDGGSAFPVHANHVVFGDKVVAAHEPGMSLRDWFAGQEKVDTNEQFEWALCEALAGPRPPGTYHSNPLEWFVWTNKWTAAVRYARADAMLVARLTKPE